MKSREAKTRELAAELLSACACNDGLTTWMATTALDDPHGVSTNARALAVEVFVRTPNKGTIVEQYAEAEAMIRTGWMP